MWYLQFLPNWIFYGILLIGIAGLLFSRFIPSYYKSVSQAVSIFAFSFGMFMTGAIKANESWQEKVKEMESKVAEAQEQSKEETVKIETKVINKTQIIRERGDEILKYIDREIVKYDTTCIIPKEFIEAHNKAAEKLK
jgi:uncharacterized membrane protein